MNELEKALITESDSELDDYLELRPTAQIRFDIEDIKRKASAPSAATRKIAAIQKIIMDSNY